MVNGTLTLTGDQSFIYHGTRPVLCINNLDSTTDEFIFIGEKLEAEQLGTVWLSPVVGPTRNISSLMEYGTMNTRASYKYSPYGKIIEKSGDLADANPYRFSSEYYDKETEFVSYYYRTYRSDIGRFISRDPIGEKGGLNLYAYVGNSPVNRWDFRGLGIRAAYIGGKEALALYLAQKTRRLETAIQRYEDKLTKDGAIKVWYEPNECPCRKSNKKGEVILVQKLKKDGKWEVDSEGQCYDEKCASGTYTRQPAYRDSNSQTNANSVGDRGISGDMHGQGNSYIDSLSYNQTLLVTAWCRCKCEDDYMLEVKRFAYKNGSGRADLTAKPEIVEGPLL